LFPVFLLDQYSPVSPYVIGPALPVISNSPAPICPRRIAYHLNRLDLHIRDLAPGSNDWWISEVDAMAVNPGLQSEKQEQHNQKIKQNQSDKRGNKGLTRPPIIPLGKFANNIPYAHNMSQ